MGAAVGAPGGPGVTDILTAVGTVGAVIVAVWIALWTEWRSDKRIKSERERSDGLLAEQREHERAALEEERRLALEREQEAAANAVQVALVADGPGDDHTWMLAVLVVNHSPFVITGVDARFHTIGQHLIDPDMREKVPGSHRLDFKLVQGMSGLAEALADTGTLGPWDDGIRFQSGSLDTSQAAGAYPVARWTDRWGVRWEYLRGEVRRIKADEPWVPLRHRGGQTK